MIEVFFVVSQKDFSVKKKQDFFSGDFFVCFLIFCCLIDFRIHAFRRSCFFKKEKEKGEKQFLLFSKRNNNKKKG